MLLKLQNFGGKRDCCPQGRTVSLIPDISADFIGLPMTSWRQLRALLRSVANGQVECTTTI